MHAVGGYVGHWAGASCASQRSSMLVQTTHCEEVEKECLIWREVLHVVQVCRLKQASKGGEQKLIG